ncbi:MAG: hypothetical protein IJZ03_06170 [Clostridia bacterium]|nr:hypothetical protein [Clostridia bacterium]
MTPALKNYLNNNKCYIEKEEFDKLICPEVIENGWLDELLDLLYECGASVSTEVIAKQLIEFYAAKKTPNHKEALETRIRYLINKHQIMLFKTLSDEKQQEKAFYNN